MMAKGLATLSVLALNASNGWGGGGGSIRPPGSQVESGINMNTLRNAHTMV